MAELYMRMVAGAAPAQERSITVTDPRMIEALDDLATYYGLGTREEAAQELMRRTIGSISRLAKALKQRRLDDTPTVADDLEGN